MLLLLKYRFKGISKNSKHPSLMVLKTPDSSGEKGRDEANKKKLFLEMSLS